MPRQAQAKSGGAKAPEPTEEEAQNQPDEEGPACQSCRKKKAKCSRKSPCSYCVKFDIECVYDDKRLKPGMRTGAIESLNQRVVALESMFLGQGLLWQQLISSLSSIEARSSKLTEIPSSLSPTASGGDIKSYTNRLKSALTDTASNSERSDVQLPESLKRRLGSNDSEPPTSKRKISEDNEARILPPDNVVNSLVEIYFANIHPWVPCIHAGKFRTRMKDPSERKKLSTIFQAIVSVCVRFSHDPQLRDSEVRREWSKSCRQAVILQSMESFSVENLQALTIVAFDTIGGGRGPAAWSFVGSMTRTVEQLQLSVEDDDSQPKQLAEYLIKRIAFLGPPKTWIEAEERRRVFWNVFLMDRFCSIATGWNFSLTGADVRRRLPCEGALWEKGEPLETPTPFFGIGDKSPHGKDSGPHHSGLRPDVGDQTCLGGFAYAIEATESLSLVTNFFLQHAVNVTNKHDIQMWLMRFKELDLRLVQWKAFLPPKWRDASAVNENGVLDPNLTLAHISHNTAVVLLHQHIAYPFSQWQASPIRLPSSSSAETCISAANEISTIAEKYLLGSTTLANPQFAFCLFITGRMLLAHSAHYKTPLQPEFNSSINSLLEISRRWQGVNKELSNETETENLASKFAMRLLEAREKGPIAAVHQPSLDIHQTVYSEQSRTATRAGTPAPFQNGKQDAQYTRDTSNNMNIPDELMATGTMLDTSSAGVHHGDLNTDCFPLQPGNMENNESPDSISLAFPPLPLAFQAHCRGNLSHTALPSPVPTVFQIPDDHANQMNAQSSEADSMVQGLGNCDDNSGISYTFDDLNSFFDHNFMPGQRISTYDGDKSIH